MLSRVLRTSKMNTKRKALDMNVLRKLLCMFLSQEVMMMMMMMHSYLFSDDLSPIIRQLKIGPKKDRIDGDRVEQSLADLLKNLRKSGPGVDKEVEDSTKWLLDALNNLRKKQEYAVHVIQFLFFFVLLSYFLGEEVDQARMTSMNLTMLLET